MPDYRVTWEITLVADNSYEAAKQAQQIQLQKQSGTQIFHVFDRDGNVNKVDLIEGEPFYCPACKRPEDECSANPCPDVIADREEEEEEQDDAKK